MGTQRRVNHSQQMAQIIKIKILHNYLHRSLHPEMEVGLVCSRFAESMAHIIQIKKMHNYLRRSLNPETEVGLVCSRFAENIF